MKVVINVCFGGFSLSPAGFKRLAELQGRECYFYVPDYKDGFKLKPAPPVVEGSKAAQLSFQAFDIPDFHLIYNERDAKGTSKERKQELELFYRQHEIDERPDKRDDPLLVQVVEELGDAANGAYAQLKVVKIPEGIDWYIENYDGNEHVAQKHQTWD